MPGERCSTTPRSSSEHRPMTNDTRSYLFTLTVNVEPGHPAYDDPEWAVA